MARPNPLDRATASDWRAWITKNVTWILTTGALLGWNVTRPEPELPPIIPQKAVQFTETEFTQFVMGMQQACAPAPDKKVKKWPQKRK